ncbi:hypothetical protein FKM82_004891 [Ascaphus truei]
MGKEGADCCRCLAEQHCRETLQLPPRSRFTLCLISHRQEKWLHFSLMGVRLQRGKQPTRFIDKHIVLI